MSLVYLDNKVISKFVGIQALHQSADAEKYEGDLKKWYELNEGDTLAMRVCWNVQNDFYTDNSFQQGQKQIIGMR